MMAPVLATKGNAVSCEDMRNCFFGSYLDSSKGPEDRQYSPVTDVPALISTMEGYLVDHNGVILVAPCLAANSLLCHECAQINGKVSMGRCIYTA